MKRVLIIDLGKDFGGAEKHVIKLCSLIKSDFSVYLLVRHKSPLHKKSLELDVEDVLSIDYSAKSFFKDVLRTKKFIEKNNITIVHSHGINSEFFVYTLKSFLKEKNIKCITTVHGIAEMDRVQKSTIEQKIFSKLQIIALKRIDSIIAVSKSIKKDLEKKGIDKNKIVIIYQSAIDNKIEDKEEYILHKPIRLCCVGRLELVKNYSYIIDLLSSMTDNNNYICDIYGDGSLKSLLEDEIKEKKIEHIIKIKGYVDNVETIYKNHDILIQPSIYESFGLSIVEAMIYGIPVICSKVGGITEIVEDKITGFLFDLNSKNELATLLRDIYNERYNLCEIVKNAQRFVEQNFKDENYKENIMKIYNGEN